jgi:hypothetical protein
MDDVADGMLGGRAVVEADLKEDHETDHAFAKI